tara:strand:+ start:848 stop:1240 length:393 start_codon:yes stop_codon:yes gene_type:complete
MSEDAVKLAVLEQKIIDFAVVVTKLDDAITKLIDVNANITKMLAVHEERIEQCHKSDGVIIMMINEFKNQNIQEHLEVTRRINEIEIKVDEISKFRWMVAGILGIIIVVAPIVADYVVGSMGNVNIEKSK